MNHKKENWDESHLWILIQKLNKLFPEDATYIKENNALLSSGNYPKIQGFSIKKYINVIHHIISSWGKSHNVLYRCWKVFN